ncbi:MAG: Lrp/AsnC family transcriptional regulator [Candidatus Micrarchaeia archaeon]
MGGMDDIDEDILAELRKDAKASLKQMARKFGVPLSTLYQRIKKLEEAKIIRNYTVDLDWKRLGYNIKAYILVYVDTTKLRELRKPQTEVLNELARLPFVFEADMVTGESDLLLMVRAKDTEDLGKQITERIQNIPGIVNTKTLVRI